MPKDNVESKKPCHLIRVGITSKNNTKKISPYPNNYGYTDLQNEAFIKSVETQKEKGISFYQAMKTQRKYAITNSMKYCGTTLNYDYKNAIPIPVNHSDNSEKKKLEFTIGKHGVSVAGVGYCNNGFCVQCMQYVRPKRIEKLKQGITHAMSVDMPVYFVTLTIPRSRTCKSQIEELFASFKVLQDRLMYRLKKQNIKKYQVRNLDITFRPEQRQVYHSHIHAIIILDKHLEPYNDRKLGYIDSFPSLVEKAWVSINEKRNIKCSLEAQHVEQIKKDNGLSRYLNKFEGLSQELMNFQHKKGKKAPLQKAKHGYTSIGFMELLGRCYKEDKKAIRIYKNFLRCIKKVRTNSFSRNWITKEEIEEEEVITHYCDVPKIEEEEEDKEEEESVIMELSWGWVMTLYDMGCYWTFDRFKLLLHLAYLDNNLKYIVEQLEGEPHESVILRMFASYNLFDI